MLDRYRVWDITWHVVLQLSSREQMEFSPPNPLEMAQDPPKSQTTGQSHQPVLVTNPLSLVPKDGAELPGMLGGAASSQSWEQDGITVWLGDVDLMGLVMWI